jgi:hypothetical protein
MFAKVDPRELVCHVQRVSKDELRFDHPVDGRVAQKSFTCSSSFSLSVLLMMHEYF